MPHLGKGALVLRLVSHKTPQKVEAMNTNPKKNVPSVVQRILHTNEPRVCEGGPPAMSVTLSRLACRDPTTCVHGMLMMSSTK